MLTRIVCGRKGGAPDVVVWGGAGQVVYAEPGSSGCERLVTNDVVLLLLTALRRPRDVVA